MWNRKGWRSVSRILEIPEEAALKSLRLTIVENRELLLENHEGLVAYSEREVKIKLAQGWLLIRGENLSLQSLQNEEILLSGKITSLSYEP
jgi:sporulation protein YqfC